MKLYYTPGACSLSPHIVAREAGLALELERVDLRSHTTEDGRDYRAVNPKGYVPALALDDGTLLTEGPAIVSYLADLKPQAKLMPPPGDTARYQSLAWLVFINGEIHKQFGPFFRRGSDEDKAAAQARILARLDEAEAALAKQPWLNGTHFGAPDAYLYVMTRWAAMFGIALPPRLTDLRERVAARPAVRQALQEEGLT